jgi:serine/threonine protein phosphatase 1
MFGSLFSRRKKNSTHDSSKNVWSGDDVSSDVDIFAIGDVHGDLTSLNRLLEKARFQDQRVLFVGDLVDRGEASSEVLELVYNLCTTEHNPAICLMGNHERMMLDFLEDPNGVGKRWLKFGGLQTIFSYGIRGITAQSNDVDMIRARDELGNALPDGLKEWLLNLPLQYQSGNVHFVHAAASPNRPMDAQTNDVLLWGHPHFFKNPRADGQWVVHGHTIVDAPIASDGRISIDTGAYATGKLTAAVVTPSGVSFIQS